MGDDEFKGHKAHRKSQKGPKVKKGKNKKDDSLDPRIRNPKAFAINSAVRAERKFRRAQDHEVKKERVPLVDRTPVEPPPFVVAIVGPSKVGKSTLFANLVKNYTRQTLSDVKGPVTLVTGKKRRLTLLECNNDINSMIDVAKVADLVLLLVDASFGFEMEVFEFLNICQVHGFPQIMGVLTHLDTFRNKNKLKKAKKTLKHRFWTEVYPGAKLFYLSGHYPQTNSYPKNEVQNLGRFISVMKFRPTVWRSEHAYVVADRMEDLTSGEILRQDPKADRRVSLYGWVHGTYLKSSVSVHIPGLGDYTPTAITALPDPCPLPMKERAFRRSLNEKEKVIYAPFSGVGGLVYDQDAVYIDLGGSHSHKRRVDVPSEEAGGGQNTFVEDLKKMKTTLDEKMDAAGMQLFSRSEKAITARDFLGDTHDNNENDDEDSGGDEEEGDEKPRNFEKHVAPDGRVRRRVVFDDDDDDDEGGTRRDQNGDVEVVVGRGGDDDDDEESDVVEEEVVESPAAAHSGKDSHIEDISHLVSKLKSRIGSNNKDATEKDVQFEEEDDDKQGDDDSEDDDDVEGSVDDSQEEVDDDVIEAEEDESDADEETEMTRTKKTVTTDNNDDDSDAESDDALQNSDDDEEDVHPTPPPKKRKRLLEEEEDPSDIQEKRKREDAPENGTTNKMTEALDREKKKRFSVAEEAFYSRFTHRSVQKMIYDDAEDYLNISSKADFDLANFSTLKEGNNGLSGDGEALKDLFIGGDYADTARRLLDADDEFGDDEDEDVFGDFEELDEGEGGEGPTKKKKPDDQDGQSRDELKKKLKEKFDMDYDDGGGEEKSFYKDWKSQVEEQTKTNRQFFSEVDDPALLQDLRGLSPGTYVRVEISSVPAEFILNFDPQRCSPLVIGSLDSANQETLAVVQARVKKHRWHKKILKTRDPVIMSVGWRRFQTMVLYSVQDHNMRNRMIKYTPEHLHCIANFYGPMTPQGTGILGIAPAGYEGFRVTLTGTILDMDKSTELVKKLKLVGHPQKIFKKSAFVEGMFSSNLEVAKFIGAKIKTVSGIRGVIKKELRAPQGAFRATFEDKILPSDIVFCRTWARVDVPQFFLNLPTLIMEKPRVMKTVGELKREREVQVTPNPDNLYTAVDRVEKTFRPLKIPKSLQKRLPYKEKPKVVAKLNEPKRIAVIREPHERDMSKFLNTLKTRVSERDAREKADKNKKLAERAKLMKKAEERSNKRDKELRKKVFRALGQMDKKKQEGGGGGNNKGGGGGGKNRRGGFKKKKQRGE